MKRSKPMRRTELARGPGPKRGGPVKSANWARRKKRRARDFGTDDRSKWWAEQPCACEGKVCDGGWSQPSHITSRGAGGRKDKIVPMTHHCHIVVWHGSTPSAWLAAAGITREELEALADYYATQGPDAPHGETA